MTQTAEPRRRYRLPVCPAWDVEATESWLQDMAAKGLVLDRDGFGLGLFTFVEADPCAMRYRLDAADTRGGLFADDMGAPPAARQELAAEAGWQYLGRRGEFWIYGCADPAAPELNTDPRVQAISLRQMEKARGSLPLRMVLGTALWAVVILLGPAGFAPVGVWLVLGTPLAALLLVLLASFLIADTAELVHLTRLRRRLRAGQPLTHRADWQTGRRRYRALRAADLAVLLATLVLFARLLGADIMDTGYQPLADYAGPLPAPTLQQLTGGQGAYTPRDLFNSNRIRVSGDLCFPVSFAYNQSGRVTAEGTTLLDGVLYVEAVETRWPWQARALAAEMQRTDRANAKRYGDVYQPLPLPEGLQADFAARYYGTVGRDTAVLAKGNRVVKLSLLVFAPEDGFGENGDWLLTAAEFLDKEWQSNE